MLTIPVTLKRILNEVSLKIQPVFGSRQSSEEAKRRRGLVEHPQRSFVVDPFQPLQLFPSVEFGYHCLGRSTLKHIELYLASNTLY